MQVLSPVQVFNVNICFEYIQGFLGNVLLASVKMYIVIFTKFSESESESVKMCFINIHLTVNTFTVNKYCKCKLLYMIVILCQNKTFFSVIFLDINPEIYCCFLAYLELIQCLVMQIR